MNYGHIYIIIMYASWHRFQIKQTMLYVTLNQISDIPLQHVIGIITLAVQYNMTREVLGGGARLRCLSCSY